MRPFPIRGTGPGGAVPMLCRLARVALTVALLPAGAVAAGDPPFDSTADTVFDIIATDDPSTYLCLADAGRGLRQMWDKRRGAEFDLDAFLFAAPFIEGPPVEIVVNPEFGTATAARAEALRYAHPLGQLPLVLREGIRQFGIHRGNPTYSAGPGKVFVYAGRTDLRIGENHLEESLLHEAVHASFDARFEQTAVWAAAQKADPGSVTPYAQSRPVAEDLAETTLFAYGFATHPNRIPPVDTADTRAVAPARLALIATSLEAPPLTDPVGPDPPGGCAP
ncbi:hypothetical protein [Chachezhania sediminis]|uniref:hypothetical protein n=1 Tax=Chachezhania sediminis TaxID=2599291 RepID=UPI00131AAA9A|nr:hypothetical protein [Chachezhania sediminis]